MRTHFLSLVCASSCIGSTGHAQTITSSTSVPTAGYIEGHAGYYTATPGTVATTGTGVVWDASTATPTGASTMYTYLPPASSPYAASYPMATLCARAEGNTTPVTWYHYRITSDIAETLGINDDEYIGERTVCEFPFDLGSSFTDDYTIFSSTYTISLEYVASGSIQAPWGTIPNVVMFEVDGGTNYLFFRASNVLWTIGYYLPGGGMGVDQVAAGVGIEEHAAGSLSIWPVPATEMVHVTLPFSGRSNVIVEDLAGRRVMERTETHSQVDLDVSSFPRGIYLVSTSGPAGERATGRVVVH